MADAGQSASAAVWPLSILGLAATAPKQRKRADHLVE
jgi:hypothetical protein